MPKISCQLLLKRQKNMSCNENYQIENYELIVSNAFPYIGEKIFSYLDFESLLNCTLVCQIWKVVCKSCDVKKKDRKSKFPPNHATTGTSICSWIVSETISKYWCNYFFSLQHSLFTLSNLIKLCFITHFWKKKCFLSFFLLLHR